MKYFITIVLLLSISILSANEMHISISKPNKFLLKWIEEQNIEIVNFRKNESIDLIIDKEQLDFLQNNHFDIKFLSTEEQRSRDIEGYRNYEDVKSELLQIAIDYPGIIELTSLGNSTCYDYYLDGDNDYSDFQFEIWCLKLSDNPETNEDEPNVFYAAEIHAREPISLEVDMYILNHLVSNMELSIALLPGLTALKSGSSR